LAAVDALFVDIILNWEMQVGIELAKRAVEMKPRVYSTGPATSYGSVPPASGVAKRARRSSVRPGRRTHRLHAVSL
jgi:hypothetical protein